MLLHSNFDSASNSTAAFPPSPRPTTCCMHYHATSGCGELSRAGATRWKESKRVESRRRELSRILSLSVSLFFAHTSDERVARCARAARHSWPWRQSQWMAMAAAAAAAANLLCCVVLHGALAVVAVDQRETRLVAECAALRAAKLALSSR